MTLVDSNSNFPCGRPHGAGPPSPVHLSLTPSPSVWTSQMDGPKADPQEENLFLYRLVKMMSVLERPSWNLPVELDQCCQIYFGQGPPIDSLNPRRPHRCDYSFNVRWMHVTIYEAVVRSEAQSKLQAL